MGILPSVRIASAEVVTGVAADPAASLVVTRGVQQLDGQVDAGLYALDPGSLGSLRGSDRRLTTLPLRGSAPMLVLLHGPCVDTAGSFGGLWRSQPQRVRELFDAYAGFVYAFEHPTLGRGLIANALALAQALPPGARLHLAGHSRGGLVAEVLAKVAGRPAIEPVDLAFFPGPEHSVSRADLQRLTDLARAKRFTVERVVRVGSPARGTLMASGRLDFYLSVLRWCLVRSGSEPARALLEFMAEVARRRGTPADLPGLADQLPDAAVIRWLQDADAVPGDLRVVAGVFAGDGLPGWINHLMADTYYDHELDAMVSTRSMFGGLPRTGGARFTVARGAGATHFGYFAHEPAARAFVDALLHDDPAGFEPIGPLSWGGQSGDGRR